MSRLTALPLALTTALAGVALLPAGGQATAALPAAGEARASAPICSGLRATKVGRPGKTLRGTAGRDVVVTNGADYVDVGKGDDLVCVTGNREAQVAAGGGDDTVVVRQRRGDVWAVLGSGSDTFLGGPGDDTVYAAGMSTATGDRDRDRIHSRGGDDTVVTGRAGGPSTDVVALGGGDDEAWIYSDDNRRGHLAAGGGTDRLVTMGEDATDPEAEWLVDAGAGAISDRGTVMTLLSGFDDYYLHDLGGASFHFRGSGRAESVTLPTGGTVSAEMRGGNDAIEIFHFTSAPILTTGTGLDGGRGRDRILMQELVHAVDGDLPAQRVTVAPADPEASYVVPLAGIEDLALSSYGTVTMTGDDGPNRMWGYSCDTRIAGGGGDDVLRSEGFVEDIECARRPAQLLGGDGDDTLVGGRYDDVLDGGEGQDSADGDKGTDTCVAEIRRRCEA